MTERRPLNRLFASDTADDDEDDKSRPEVLFVRIFRKVKPEATIELYPRDIPIAEMESAWEAVHALGGGGYYRVIGLNANHAYALYAAGEPLPGSPGKWNLLPGDPKPWRFPHDSQTAAPAPAVAAAPAPATSAIDQLRAELLSLRSSIEIQTHRQAADAANAQLVAERERSNRLEAMLLQQMQQKQPSAVSSFKELAEVMILLRDANGGERTGDPWERLTKATDAIDKIRGANQGEGDEMGGLLKSGREVVGLVKDIMKDEKPNAASGATPTPAKPAAEYVMVETELGRVPVPKERLEGFLAAQRAQAKQPAHVPPPPPPAPTVEEPAHEPRRVRQDRPRFRRLGAWSTRTRTAPSSSTSSSTSPAPSSSTSSSTSPAPSSSTSPSPDPMEQLGAVISAIAAEEPAAPPAPAAAPSSPPCPERHTLRFDPNDAAQASCEVCHRGASKMLEAYTSGAVLAPADQAALPDILRAINPEKGAELGAQLIRSHGIKADELQRALDRAGPLIKDMLGPSGLQ